MECLNIVCVLTINGFDTAFNAFDSQDNFQLPVQYSLQFALGNVEDYANALEEFLIIMLFIHHKAQKSHTLQTSSFV